MAPAPTQAANQLALTRYDRMTRVAIHCTRPGEARAIIVCGRRAADKWRVPFVGYDIGDPRTETVSSERNRLASEPRPTCGTTAFFATANCGRGVGVVAKVGIGRGAAGLRLRPLGE